MITDNYKVEIDYLDGQGYKDVSGVEFKTFILTEYLHKDLSPTENTLSITISPNILFQNKLAACSDMPKIRAYKNDVLFFSGFVRNNFEDEEKILLQPSKLECITLLQKLKVKIGYDLSFANPYVCNNNDTSTSFVHNLLYYFGLSVTDIIIPNILYTIPVWNNIAYEGSTYFDVISEMLKEYGYILSTNAENKLIVYKIRPDVLTPVGAFTKGQNILNKIKRTKEEEEYLEFKVSYLTTKTLTDKTVFDDTGDKKIAPYSYYGADEGNDEWYANYKVENETVLGVLNASLVFEAPSYVSVQTFQPGQTSALIKIYNDSTAEQTIEKLKIKATAICKKSKINCYYKKVLHSGKEYKYDTKYTFNKDVAFNFLNDLAYYYAYSDFSYELDSKTDYPIGSVVNVISSWGTLLCRIQAKKTKCIDDLITYTLEGISEHNYVTPTITTDKDSGTEIPDEIITIIDGSVNDAVNNIVINKFPDDEYLHAYYSLNDSAAFYNQGLMYDNSGKSNHGHSINCALLPNSKSGRGYVLTDGSYAELDNIESTDDAIKVSLWIKTTDSDGCIVSANADSGEIIYQLNIESGKAKVYYMIPTGTYNQAGIKVINDNQYHHIVIDVSKTAGVKVYIDAVIDINSTQIASLELLDKQEFFLGVENEVETINGESGFYFITEDGKILETE